MAKKSKRKSTKLCPHNHVMWFGIPFQPGSFRFVVPVSDATSTVKIEREEIDVLSGKPGIATACADMKCAMRSSAAFPHPVYFAEFTKTCAFFVDKVKNGVPVHCIRYMHDDHTIAIFDIPGVGKKELIKSGQAKRVITLSPRPPARISRPKVADLRSGKRTGERRKYMPINALGRAIEAGLINPAHAEFQPSL